ncbi:hypothetical protein BCR33DRAFT_737742 [Rhizoclosmatium globosum]|uniref:Velvet domain-containing protein n=1 Tax=Rhizoclosmatium globosum TaxID=329046 RepID=A0A1Y2CD18_9FUNG|nr:hypothetical protein BCR33DRAFT_737742 [Rhizoclosmatium globosum]|eukprot:ORY44714.1 hypothetical protein BCR33DRAFT_737742 [Rhizoclosmatium globosum]
MDTTPTIAADPEFHIEIQSVCTLNSLSTRFTAGRAELATRTDDHSTRFVFVVLVRWLAYAPILSLQVKENGKNLPPAELYTDSFVLRVELWNEDGSDAVVTHANIPTEKSILAGNIFSSSMVLRDQNGIPGIYFIFSDLSVRIHGTFRLKFYLYNMMAETGVLNRGKMSVITSIMSNPFTIYSSKSFPGTVMPSELITAFIEQGIRMPNRKKGAWDNDDGSDDEIEG